jgi:hypothetical protein
VSDRFGDGGGMMCERRGAIMAMAVLAGRSLRLVVRDRCRRVVRVR